MDKIFNWTSTIIGIVGGFFAAIFGQWDSILWALLVIMVLDYLTGIIKAIYTKTMSSEIGFKGLLLKDYYINYSSVIKRPATDYRR